MSEEYPKQITISDVEESIQKMYNNIIVKYQNNFSNKFLRNMTYSQFHSWILLVNPTLRSRFN